MSADNELLPANLGSIYAFCWGARLQGSRNRTCGGTLTKRSKRHFKCKFCLNCQWTMAIPATRVRPLTDDLRHTLSNRRSFGMWTVSSRAMGAFQYRIVNNTMGCARPALIIFEKEPPSRIAWSEVDPNLVDEHGRVPMCVSKGTVIPIKHTRASHLPRLATMTRIEPMSPQSTPPSTPESSPPSTPLPPLSPCCLPEVDVQVSMEALSPSEFTLSDPESSEKDRSESPEPDLYELDSPESDPPTLYEVAIPSLRPKVRNYSCTAEDRKQRNRDSAAKSRLAKRQYIFQLETRIEELSQMATKLSKENSFWRSLALEGPRDPTCPLVACAGFKLELEN
jgi:hypothetical protein